MIYSSDSTRTLTKIFKKWQFFIVGYNIYSSINQLSEWWKQSLFLCKFSFRQCGKIYLLCVWFFEGFSATYITYIFLYISSFVSRFSINQIQIIFTLKLVQKFKNKKINMNYGEDFEPKWVNSGDISMELIT